MFDYINKLMKMHNLDIDLEQQLNIIEEHKMHKMEPENLHYISKYMLGGNKYEFSFNNKKVIFFKTTNDINKQTIYSIKEYNKNNSPECVIIIIEKNIAIIHSLGKSFGCQDTNKSMLTGSEILDMTIEFLKYKKKELGINKIKLKDLSKKHCGTISINLSMMHILLYGTSWYNAHGFVPQLNTSSQTFVENMIKKNKMTNKKTIKEIPDFKNYIKSSFIEYNKAKLKDITEKDINYFIEKINNNPDMKISDFLKLFLKDFKKYCKLFHYFYMDLFVDMGYVHFPESTYIMDI
jgi:hypothetical protein